MAQTAHLVAKFAVLAGKWAQPFPFFTTAMRGGTVTPFTRTEDAPIDPRCLGYEPDTLALFKINLSEEVKARDGLRSGGVILKNDAARSTSSTLGEPLPVDAEGIAMDTPRRRVFEENALRLARAG